jgi:hypothetical protein
MKRILVIFIILLSITSCGKKGINTRGYYFPYANFIESTTYKYIDSKDSSKVMYWNFNSIVQNGDTVFTTGIYNKEFVLVSVFVNRVWDEGVELNEMYVNTGETDTLYKCEVKSGEVFNWRVDPKVSLFVSYAISSKNKIQTEEVVSERIFDPKKEMASYNGKEYECLVVREKTLINHVMETTTKTEEQERNSFFAQGIGLIQFETFNADATSNVFKLEKILNKAEWEKIQPIASDTTTQIAE